VEQKIISHTADVDIFALVANAGMVGKSVLLFLLLYSIISWGIIIFKLSAFKRIRNETNEFNRIFIRQKSLEAIYNTSKKMKECPVAKVFFSGYTEFASQFKASGAESMQGDRRFFLDKIDSISRAMDRGIGEEITKMERFLFFLATSGSTAPFIGLFGTVWGIMVSFESIGITGSSNIAVVAPGIAEALIATAAGLLTAVPSVIAYNYFNHRVKVFATEMDNFSLDFLSLIEKNFVRK